MNPIVSTSATLAARYPATSTARLGPGWSLVLVSPPYGPENVRTTPADLARLTAGAGTLVGVRLTRARVEVEALRALLRELAVRIPSSPVLVLLDLPLDDSLAAIARLAPLRLRALVPVGESMSAILREVLTDPTTLAAGVLDWLRDRQLRLNPNQADLIERVIGGALDHAELGPLLDELGIPGTSARFRMHKRRLPTPSRWFQLGRALHATLRLQADPDASVARVAHQLGFADHSALAHLLRRSCGVQASEVRDTLGWEWLLHRWWIRRRVRVL